MTSQFQFNIFWSKQIVFVCVFTTPYNICQNETVSLYSNKMSYNFIIYFPQLRSVGDAITKTSTRPKRPAGTRGWSTILKDAKPQRRTRQTDLRLNNNNFRRRRPHPRARRDRSSRRRVAVRPRSTSIFTGPMQSGTRTLCRWETVPKGPGIYL